MMKKIIAILVMLAVTVPAAVWAGEEFFSPAEKQKICRVAARAFPKADVSFNGTTIDGADILIGPLPNGQNLFIYIKAGSEIFTYKLPPEYDQPVFEILKTVHGIVDNRPASDPRALGRNLIK